MVAHREVQLARCSPLTHHDVGVLVGAHRDARVRQVRHRQQQGLQLRLDLLQAGGGLLELVLERGNLRHYCIDRLALALELPDLLGQLVALRLQFFGAALDGLALGFQRGEGDDVEEALRRLARFEPGDDRGQVFTKQGDV